MTRRVHPDPKAALDTRTAELLSRTAAFCDAHLNEEYKELCAKLIGKMRRKRAVLLVAGRLEIWAASVIYALGQINFLLTRAIPPTPHLTRSRSFLGSPR